MKKILIFAVLIISTNGLLHAQNWDMKYYIDYDNDYRGAAMATYYNNSEIKVVEEKLKSKGRDLDKLTKTNFWLCKKALDEWDVKDGETYLIICAATRYSEDFIMIMATIENDGQSFSWWGKSVSEEDWE